MQDMPSGQYTRRLESDGFKKQWSGKMAIEWLEWQAYQQQIKIRLGYNNSWAFCTEHAPNLARDPWGEGVKFNMAAYE